jgi:nicotinamide mononucleotide transporter
LYSECILYSFYVVIGIYGYFLWSKRNGEESSLEITKWALTNHISALIIGIIFSITVGYYFDNFTDADKSYLDAFTTIFSFLASYMEAKKVLTAWVFWIILNGLSIYLYFSKGLNIYALLALIYFVISFYGYYEWKRKYNLQDHDLKYLKH